MSNKSTVKLRNRALSEQTTISYYRQKVFGMTFIAYAMSHLLRKSYTTCKVQMTEEAGLDPLILSAMDTVFMFCYAIGSVCTGRLGDTFYAPTIIGLGLVGSSCCVCLLALGLVEGPTVAESSFVGVFFLLTWACNGFFQSAGGPVGTAIMGNWFTMKNRGWIFGIWTAHQYIGNIVAALQTSLILYLSIHWIYALLLPASLNVLWGIAIIYHLPERPEDVQLETEESAARALEMQLAGYGSGRSGDYRNSLNSISPISFVAALRIPNVISYALAFGFLKLINYSLFFWLPYFLSRHFTPSQSNLISILYDVGLMPGGAIVGSLSDYFGGRRACVITAFMIILIPILWIFSQYALHLSALNLLGLLVITGILVGGPNSIITSVVAVDLAQHPSIRGNGQALGTVTGIINGTGSMTAALGLCLIGPLQTRHGWEAVWYFLMACVFAAVALIFPKVHKEIYEHDADFQRVSLGKEEVTPSSKDIFASPLPLSCIGEENKLINDQRNQHYQYQGYRYGAIPCHAQTCK